MRFLVSILKSPVKAIRRQAELANELIVPALCVVTPPVTLCVTPQERTQSVQGCIPTQSEGMINVALGIHRMLKGIQLMVDRVLDLNEVPKFKSPGADPGTEMN